ncbi:MAG: flagellin [Bdellovibrionota bacterium]
MSTINNKTITARLNRHLKKAQRDQADSLSKLSSGSNFTAEDPRPSERALAEKMEYKIRSLSTAKQNINDAVSLLQTAESSMAEINNLVTRMKEINVSAATTTISDQERRYLFIEYEALHDEVNRIAQTTEFNGIPLLNGSSDLVPDELVFRVGDPMFDEEGNIDDDLNAIRFSGLKAINATTAALGITSAREILADSSEKEGIELSEIEDMIIPEDDDNFATVYDQAINNLSTQRAIFGALQTRLNYSMSFIDIFQENIAAAKSRIADTDYADEVAKLTAAKITTSAATSMLAQNNISSDLTYQLIQSLY